MTEVASLGRDVRGVLQAGGRGQRFGPITDTIPKPLVPIDGVPMIERLVRQFVHAGVADICIITGWLGDKIERHFDRLSDLPPQARMTFVREKEPLGNFAGVAELPPCVKTNLFAFADLVTTINFAELLNRHWGGKCDATLASHEECYQVSLGELVVDDNVVTAYNEKPLKRYVICSGVLAFEPRMLSVIERGRAAGLSDFITSALAAGFKVNHWPHGEAFIDVNRPELIDQANGVARLESAADI